MIKKVILTLLITCLSFTSLIGCGTREVETNIIKDLTPTGQVTTQTSQLGISTTEKNFQSKLENNHYYVLHEGTLYPLYAYGDNYEGDAPDNVVNGYRQMYFTTENEINIPTLFEGDSLVYYSADGLLDYMTWERYYDLGYTIGLINLQTMKSGRVYLDLSDEDEVNIIPDSELMDIHRLNVERILIDKIGGIQVDSSLIENGVIRHTQKSKEYDLEIYTGTYFKHFNAVANIHLFKAYELYASIEYTPMQEFLYEITIPEYFADGYYLLNGAGMIRIVHDTVYDETTDFNKQVLFPSVNDKGTVTQKNAAIYSTYEPLNEFKTNIEGCLGYVAPEEEDTINEEEVDIILKEALVKEIDLFFPKDKMCTVKVISLSNEKTGDISLQFGTSKKLLNYNAFDQEYSFSLKGTGQKGTLKIAGLTKNYNIELTNCEQYINQIEETSNKRQKGDTSTESEELDVEDTTSNKRR